MGRTGIGLAAIHQLLLARHLDRAAIAATGSTTGAGAASVGGAPLRPHHHLAAITPAGGIGLERAAAVDAGAGGVATAQAQRPALVAAAHTHRTATRCTRGLQLGCRQRDLRCRDLDRAAAAARTLSIGAHRGRTEQPLARLHAHRAAIARAARIQHCRGGLHHRLARLHRDRTRCAGGPTGLDRRAVQHRACRADRHRRTRHRRRLQHGLPLDRHRASAGLNPGRLQQHVAPLGIEQQLLIHREQTSGEAQIAVLLQPQGGQGRRIVHRSRQALHRHAAQQSRLPRRGARRIEHPSAHAPACSRAQVQLLHIGKAAGPAQADAAGGEPHQIGGAREIHLLVDEAAGRVRYRHEHIRQPAGVHVHARDLPPCIKG